MSITNLMPTFLWFLLVSSFTGANKANVNCLRSIKSQVKDPKRSLSSWVFRRNVTASSICRFSGVECWDENRVMKIDLFGYGLKGEFPLGLNDCSSLTGLDLSGNSFTGVLPSNISSLIPFVTTLDLSYNRFSGEIPTSLSNVAFLNTLMLQHNQFTGQLPPQLVLLGRLKEFSVTNNFLSGPIPKFNEAWTFGLDMFANNTDLCGSPMEPCIYPEEEMIRFGKMGAAFGAAVFAPLGAFLGWFFDGRKAKQGNMRHRS